MFFIAVNKRLKPIVKLSALFIPFDQYQLVPASAKEFDIDIMKAYLQSQFLKSQD